MDATQAIQDLSFNDEEEENVSEEDETQPVAKLKVLKNGHIPETELPLYPGENILGRDSSFCTVPLPAPSMSKRHATISITVFRSNGHCVSVATEALIWDMGSLNGCRKGRLKLQPHVRYALSEGDKVILADVPCQYVLVRAKGENGEGRPGTPDCLVRERDKDTSPLQAENCKANARTEMGTDADSTAKRTGTRERGFLTPSSEQGDARQRSSQERSAKAPMVGKRNQSPAPLVPESDSESDGERETWRPKPAKHLVSSDSESPIIPQPACSTFQSPSGATCIPESPSTTERGRVNETVSSEEHIWTDRSTEAALNKPRPDPLEFNMDSDTDVEGEEEKENGQRKSSPGAHQAHTNSAAGTSTRPVSTRPDFHVDSDTDIEGDEHETSDANSKKASISAVRNKPSSPAAQVELHSKSDADVEDEYEVPMVVQVDPPTACRDPSNDIAESRPAHAAEFHMDSDTDVEEEGDDRTEVLPGGAVAAGSTTSLTNPEEHLISDSADRGADVFQQPNPSTAFEIQPDSDTDVEEEEENVRQPAVPSGVPHLSGHQPAPEASQRAPDCSAGAAESDQDTDVEEQAAGPAAGKQEVAAPAITSDDFNMDSDTDVEEETRVDSSLLKALEKVSAAGVQCSTPIEAGMRIEEMETQLFGSPSHHFAYPMGPPPLKPVVTSDEGPDVDFVPETQSFAMEPEGQGAAGVSPLDETALEETQAFGTSGEGEGSARLQLSMSDNSRLLHLATESTQAYTLPELRDSDEEGDSDLAPTQDYGALQATQAYAPPAARDEEDTHVDITMAETQAFFFHGSAEVTPPVRRDVKQAVMVLEEEPTQLTESDIYSHISTADTVILQRSQKLGGEESEVMSATALTTVAHTTAALEFHVDSDTDVDEEKDDGLQKIQAESTSLQIPTATHIMGEDIQLHSDSESADTCDEDPFKPGNSRPTMSSAGSRNASNIPCAETQPMSTIDDEEEEEEEEQPVKRKIKTRRALESSDIQPSERLLIAETLPMAISENDDGDDDAAPKPTSPKKRGRPSRRKGKQAGDKSAADAASSCLSTAQTQPLANEDEEEEKEHPKPAVAKRELTKTPLSSCLSVAETQPISVFDSEDGDDEGDPRPASPKRRGRPRRERGKQGEDDRQQAEVASSTCLSAVETQPMAAFYEEEEDKDDTQPMPSTSRAKTRGAGKEPVMARSSRARGKTEEKRQGQETDEGANIESKRQTRGKAPAVKKRGGRRGKMVEEEEEDTEEKPVQETSVVRRGRGRKSVVQEQKEELESEKKEQEKERIEKGQKDQEEELKREKRAQQEKEKVETKRREEERLEKECQEREKKEKEERVRKEQEEKERLEEERKRIERERREKEERERKEQEEKERVERERLQQEKKEKEERERIEREQREKEAREKREAEERERLEKKRLEKECQEREKKEKEEKVRKEQEEKERLEKERREEERKRIERERREKEERERKEQEEKERVERERLQQEKKEKEERERIEREQREKEAREKREAEERERLEKRLEKERKEKERMERERREKERREADEKEQLEKERLEKERKEREEEERIDRERREKEENDRREAEEKEQLEMERLEKQRNEEEERQRLEQEQKKQEVGRKRGRKETSARSAKEKQSEQHSEMEKQESDDKPRASTRGRRAAPRRAAPASPGGQEESVLPTDNCPAMRTRSRSSSSNSVSSERSTSSVRSSTSRQGAPESHNCRRSTRGRPARAPPAEAERPTLEDGASEAPSGRRSRRPSISSNSVGSEASEPVDVASQSKGRGRGRGRKSMKGKDPGPEAEPKLPALEPQVNKPSEPQVEEPSEPQVEEPSAIKTSEQRRRGNKAGAGDEAGGSGLCQAKSEDSPAKDKAAPRGRGGAKVSKPGSKAMGEGGQTVALEGNSNTDSDPSKASGRHRCQKARPPSQSPSEEEASGSADVKIADVSTTTSRKRSHDEEYEELEETEEIRFKIPRGKAKVSKGPSKAKTEDCSGVAELQEKDEQVASGPVQRRGKGRPSVSQKKKEMKKEMEESGETTSAAASTSSAVEENNETEPEESSEKGSRKRGAATAESPTPAKSIRRSVGSSRQAHKVLFTGVTDDLGETTVGRLGGSMAKSVNDMTHLVTDAVRRTVKFMCAVARGVPIVTPNWLKKSEKAGDFLPPDEFLVKDAEQERKFNFSLKESLNMASSQPLLQGYEIHVTRSVKPEPAQMKDIITSCGARYLPKMPSVNKPQTVVVSCTEDAALCSPALAASVPVVSSEFLLTGILQQQADVVAHALSIPQAPARSRKKT